MKPKPVGTDLRAPVSLTFVIPVRHPDNAASWRDLQQNIAQTFASVAGQLHPSWRAYVAVQEGADLPPLPPGFHDVRVRFPPNPGYAPDGQSRNDFHEAVRFDKGRRVLAALLAAGPTSHVMVVDDDDFVSNRLAGTVAKAAAGAAFRFDDGYVWSPGSRMLMKHQDFSSLCGTSAILPFAALALPHSLAAASPDYVRTMLGSHVQVKAALEQQGQIFTPLPYPGAVYRVGHANAHSRSKGVLRTHLLNGGMIRNPRRLLRNLLLLRRYGKPERAEFGLP
jgi:hypothetical protein